jgi:hypothetical protein
MKWFTTMTAVLYLLTTPSFADYEEQTGNGDDEIFLPHSIPSTDELYPNLVTSRLLRRDEQGRLIYIPDSKGNRVPDFSYVGYRNGEVDIPNVPVVKTLSPVSGDNRTRIQDAINEISNLPLVNGFRGALLLRAGVFRVSGDLKITKSGVVIRGSGSGSTGTRILSTSRSQITVVRFLGSGGASETGETGDDTRKTIQGQYIPIGTRTVTVDSDHRFKVGDRVFINQTRNSAWVSLLGMGQYGWSPSSYTFDYKRTIVAVNGNKITLDAPLVEPIDKQYGNAHLTTYSWNGRLENVGIENLQLDSVYSSSTDESHAKDGVEFANTENGWMRNVEAFHFVGGAVKIQKSSSNISVLDSKCIDPISKITGGRRYSFNVEGQRNLIFNCLSRNGRHDYVTGARVCGPNAFVRSRSQLQRGDNGPHHRWATGGLFDNIVGNGQLNVRNRKDMGSGHGWAGSQTMVWNSTSKTMLIESPPKHVNWVIGGKGDINGDRGYEELTNQTPWPQSLYEQQMCDRLGKFCSN